MASGSISKAFTSHDYKLIVDWSSSGIISSNSSTVKAVIKLYCPYRLSIGARSGNTIKINGKSYSYNSSAINGTGTFTLATVNSDSIAHNSDGTKSVSISCSFDVNATISGNYYGTITASGTAKLDDLPRAATIDSAPNFNDEENPTIKYSNPAGSVVTTLRACISLDGSTDDVAYRDISKSGSSYTFNLTDAERKVLRQATTGSNSRTVRFYIMSVIGGVTYRKHIAKTFTVINGAPTLKPTVKDIGEVSTTLTGDAEYSLIKGYNVMEVAANATAKKEATIKSYKISCGGKSITTASGKLSYVESGTFTFSVTDSRGNVTTQKVNRELIDYKKVTCTLSNAKFSPEGVITFTVRGHFWVGNFGAVENAVDIRYKVYPQGGSGEWVSATATVNEDNTYTADVTVSGLDYMKKYVVVACAADACYRFDNDDMIISPKKVLSCIPVFDWGADDFKFNTKVRLANGKPLQGMTTGGASVNMIYLTSGDNLQIGGGAYPPDNIFISTKDNSGSVSINGKPYGVNRVLWEGAYYMTEGQSANLTEAVSAQTNGIVLVFSRYDISNSEALNEHFCYHFVPKQIISLHSGKGSVFNMNTSNQSFAASKYLYISDTVIAGHANNGATGTGDTGVKYSNNRFVLRYVIGI